MTARELRGLPASPGVAIGRLLLLEAPAIAAGPHRGATVESAAALAALDAVAEGLAARAARLRSDGLAEEADILETNRLMALDPLLRSEVEQLAAELDAAGALQAAADRHAEVLAALEDPLLAARASDIRQLGRRTARKLGAADGRPAGGEPSVLVAVDLGPADVADVRESEHAIVAIALAAGAATSHAAIMARSLGLPMVVGAGDGLLHADEGAMLIVDGDAGLVQLDPDGSRRAWAHRRMQELERKRLQFARERTLPPVTRDGRWITLLANAATAVEVRAALDAEADGIGLLRTELAFLDAQAWPSEDEHVAALAPLFELLPGLVATVRVLDFGSDKTPPFLSGTDARGIALLLERPDALAAQLRAILRVAGGTELRLLVPLVEAPEQLRGVRALLRTAATDVGWSRELPPVGAMIETPAAVRRAHELACDADFLSVGTNDLVQYALGLDRTEPLATARSAADPVILNLIAKTVAAAHDAGLAIEICGESASVPELAALYVGLAVDELSVAPARVDELRSTVRALSSADAAAAATEALGAATAEAALAQAETLLSGESGNEPSEVLGGLGSVRA